MEEGAAIEDVDRAMIAFGFPGGPDRPARRGGHRRGGQGREGHARRLRRAHVAARLDGQGAGRRPAGPQEQARLLHLRRQEERGGPVGLRALARGRDAAARRRARRSRSGWSSPSSTRPCSACKRASCARRATATWARSSASASRRSSAGRSATSTTSAPASPVHAGEAERAPRRALSPGGSAREHGQGGEELSCLSPRQWTRRRGYDRRRQTRERQARRSREEQERAHPPAAHPPAQPRDRDPDLRAHPRQAALTRDPAHPHAGPQRLHEPEAQRQGDPRPRRQHLHAVGGRSGRAGQRGGAEGDPRGPGRQGGPHPDRQPGPSAEPQPGRALRPPARGPERRPPAARPALHGRHLAAPRHVEHGRGEAGRRSTSSWPTTTPIPPTSRRTAGPTA